MATNQRELISIKTQASDGQKELILKLCISLL